MGALMAFPALQQWNSDPELVRAIIAREPGAFEELERRCDQQILRIARKSASRLRQPTMAAEDIYQKLCIAIIKSLNKWQPTGELSHFVSRVAFRKAIDIYRHEKKEFLKTGRSMPPTAGQPIFPLLMTPSCGS